MIVEIRPLQAADDRQVFRSGDPALDLYFHRYAGQNQFRHHIGVSYVAVEGTRFVPLDVVEGASPQRPEPTPMFLALGSVPRR